MATPSEKQADALESLHQLQTSGSVAIRLKGENWCLSPDQSIALHTENMTVPKQLLVRAIKARNNVTMLPHGTSLLDIRSALPEPDQVKIKNGLRLYSLPAALIACSKHSFTQNPTNMRAALSMISDASEVLAQLLAGGHTSIAGRLAGAFRNIGRDQIADDIVSTMRSVEYYVREVDPFETQSSLSFSSREQSPYVNRIRIMWQDMREVVIAHFPAAPAEAVDKNAYMQHVEDVYITDAYQAVRASIGKILDGDNAGKVVDSDHRTWYREMFTPGVTAGINKPADLAGYRNAPVFIRRSMHSPPSKEAVRDAMPAFFKLLEAEENAAVRVVLGHFIFVYIHPYMDGNGRTGRFLMHAMLASGGYPWTIFPLEKRSEYMTALEEASTKQDIEPFAKFLGSLVQATLVGKSLV